MGLIKNNHSQEEKPLDISTTKKKPGIIVKKK